MATDALGGLEDGDKTRVADEEGPERLRTPRVPWIDVAGGRLGYMASRGVDGKEHLKGLVWVVVDTRQRL